MLLLSFYIFLLGCLYSTSSHAVLNFRSSTSSIKVVEGTGLQLDKKILNCRGKIIREKDGMINGQDIIFNQGSFDDAGKKMSILGTFKTGATNKIVLNGSKSFRAEGQELAQEIEVSGDDNRIEGEINLGTDLIILDSNSTLTCAVLRSFVRNIQLNEGSLFLEENLSFVEDKKIIGNGTVRCNGRKITLGSKETNWNGSIYFENVHDLELKATLHLAQTWTFSGPNNTLVGNGNILVLENYGQLVVEQGSQLVLRNIVIQNVADRNITCYDNAGKIIFQDAVLLPSDNYIFDKGSFDVYGVLDISGSYTFVFQPATFCTIKSSSKLKFSNNMTLSVDLVTTATDLLQFEDSSSVLAIKNSSLHVTSTGLHLKRGKLSVDGVSSLFAEFKLHPARSTILESGILIGNDQSIEDFFCEIVSGATLILKNGWLIYKNLDVTAWRLKALNSVLQINDYGALVLYQPMSPGLGSVRVQKFGALLQGGSNYFDGTVEFFN